MCSSLKVQLNSILTLSHTPYTHACTVHGVLCAIVGFTVADAISVVGQTRQNLQRMFGINHDFEAQ